MGYVYIALAFMVALAGAGWKGYDLGIDHERVANLAAAEQARKEAEAYSKGQRASARQSAANLQTALAKQKGLAHALGDSLAKHIAAMPPPPKGCPAPVLTDSLLNDWNGANAGSGAAGGSVPGPSGVVAPADGREPRRGDPKPLGSR